MSLTKKQQAIRRTGYGSSEVATICGLNRWERPIKVYERKVLEETGGRASVMADLGELLEEPVAVLYARRTGLHCRRVQTITHPTLAIVKATPDRAVFDVAPTWSRSKKLDYDETRTASKLLEVKTVDEKDRKLFGEAGSDFMPHEKLAQVTWQLGALDMKRADVAVLFGRREWEIFSVDFDADLFRALYDQVLRFDVEHVRARRPPAVDGSKAYEEYLQRLHRTPTGPQRIATEPELAVMLNFMKLRTVRARLERLFDREANRMREIIGSSLGVVANNVGAINLSPRAGRVKVDYETIARQSMQLAGFVLNTLPVGPNRSQLELQLKTLIEKNTTTGQPTRVFDVRPERGGVADYELKALEVMLEQLDEKTGEDGARIADAVDEAPI